MDPGTQLSLDIISGSRKRRHTDNDESDEEGAENSISAPVNDIYRSRQQKKVKWIESVFLVVWEWKWVHGDQTSCWRNCLCAMWKIHANKCVDQGVKESCWVLLVEMSSLLNVSEYKVLACVYCFVMLYENWPDHKAASSQENIRDEFARYKLLKSCRQDAVEGWVCLTYRSLRPADKRL